jgi:hypothetical protein
VNRKSFEELQAIILGTVLCIATALKGYMLLSLAIHNKAASAFGSLSITNQPRKRAPSSSPHIDLHQTSFTLQTSAELAKKPSDFLENI